MQMDPVIRARRKALREAQAWLHARALEMNDLHARQVLNSAAFDFGCEKLRGFDRETGSSALDAISTHLQPSPPTGSEPPLIDGPDD